MSVALAAATVNPLPVGCGSALVVKVYNSLSGNKK